MARREFSAGGVVLRKKGRTLEVLLIKDAYGRWSWPKGNIAAGEHSQDAALREIEEEVGLKDIAILARLGRVNYFYRLRGELIFKTVFFFLVESRGREKLRVQRSEIKAARWFKPDEALRTVEYKGAKERLAQAIEMYKSLRKGQPEKQDGKRLKIRRG